MTEARFSVGDRITVNNSCAIRHLHGRIGTIEAVVRDRQYIVDLDDPRPDDGPKPTLMEASIDPIPPVRAMLLARALEITMGQRNEQNGDPRPNHENIAKLWNAYLSTSRFQWGDMVELEPSDVAAMMTLFKIARSCEGEFNLDDYLDAAAYAAITGELRDQEEGE